MMWLIIFFVVVAYAVMAGLCWLVEAYMDGAFTGEGDGFTPAQRRQRLYYALAWPWWPLEELLKTVRRKILAAFGR